MLLTPEKKNAKGTYNSFPLRNQNPIRPSLVID